MIKLTSEIVYPKEGLRIFLRNTGIHYCNPAYHNPKTIIWNFSL